MTFVVNWFEKEKRKPLLGTVCVYDLHAMMHEMQEMTGSYSRGAALKFAAGFSPQREQKCRAVWRKIFQSHQDFCPHKISQDPRRIGSNRMFNPSWTAGLKINHLHSNLSKNAFPCASSAFIAVWSKARMQKLLEAFSFHDLGPKTFLSRGKAFNTWCYSRLHRTSAGRDTWMLTCQLSWELNTHHDGDLHYG